MCIFAQDKPAGKALAAFTGDTLFVGSVGRPDLVNEKEKTPQQMVLLMYTTLFDKIQSLPNDILLSALVPLVEREYKENFGQQSGNRKQPIPHSSSLGRLTNL